jgi:outer membrane protein assembly factor BamE (lipoprotein component of BamABCDE complex)
MTRRHLLLLALLGPTAFAVAGSGCSVMGRRHYEHPLSQDVVAQIEPGMHKARVTELLGAPQEILFSNKELDPLVEHAYIYEYKVDAGTAIFFVVVNFGRLDSRSDRVIVFLDPAGLVTHVGSSFHSDEASFGFPFGG